MSVLFLIFICGFVTTAHAQGCGSTLTAVVSRETFTSPNYPGNYPNNLNCAWTIDAPRGYAVQITFDPFFTESCCDYVQVYDGAASMGQYRGRKTNLALRSTTTSLRIVLHSDDSIAGTGFIATYAREDIDECAEGLNNCGPNSDCTNIRGSFRCGCKLGYRGNGTHCEEINECESITSPHNCHDNAVCTNLIGRYRCDCNPGYTGDGVICVDIDECEETTICDANVQCTNYQGGYTCVCNQGYTGDGHNCEDIDECHEGVNNCDRHAHCYNTIGSYRCECKPGFNGNGNQCIDINECVTNPPDCAQNAGCKNLPGSYTCACNNGYSGDGIHCIKAFSVLCLPETISVRMVAKYFTDKDIALSDLHFNDYSCRGTVDEVHRDIWVFNITTLSSCSTVRTSNSTHLTYTNTLSNVLQGNRVYVGRAHLNTFSCSYKKFLNDSSRFTFNYGVLQDIANITAPSNLGVFIATMNHFTDNTYSKIETNTNYDTSARIYVKVDLRTTDEHLKLVLDRCWITPTPRMDHKDNFSFIRHGCPIDDSGNVLITDSGKSQMAKFESQVFAYVDYSRTYLHCCMFICFPMPGHSCEPVCRNGENVNSYSVASNSTVNFHFSSDRRQKRGTKEPLKNDEILSLGPFRMQKSCPVPQGVTMTMLTSGMMLVVCLACCMFVAVTYRRSREIPIAALLANQKAQSVSPSPSG